MVQCVFMLDLMWMANGMILTIAISLQSTEWNLKN